MSLVVDPGPWGVDHKGPAGPKGAILTRARRVPDFLLLLTLRASHFSGRASCFLKIRSPGASGRSWDPTDDVPGTTATSPAAESIGAAHWWRAVQYIALILVGTATRQCAGRLPSVDVPLVDSRARVLLCLYIHLPIYYYCFSI